MTNTSTYKQIHFGEPTYIEPSQHALNPNCWWGDRELNLHQQIDLLDAQKPNGERRGLEQHFQKNSLRQDICNIRYAPSVVQRYRMNQGLLGKVMRRSKESTEDRLQKYCSKQSRHNTLKALRLAQQDEQKALEIYEADGIRLPEYNSDSSSGFTKDISITTERTIDESESDAEEESVTDESPKIIFPVSTKLIARCISC